MSSALTIEVPMRSWGSSLDLPRKTCLDPDSEMMRGITEVVCLFFNRTDMKQSAVRIGDIETTARAQAALRILATMLTICEKSDGGDVPTFRMFIVEERDRGNSLAQLRYYLVSNDPARGSITGAFLKAILEISAAKAANDAAEKDAPIRAPMAKRPRPAETTKAGPIESFEDWRAVISAYLGINLACTETVVRRDFTDTTRILNPTMALSPYHACTLFRNATADLTAPAGMLEAYLSQPVAGGRLQLTLPRNGSAVWLIPLLIRGGLDHVLQMALPLFEHESRDRVLRDRHATAVTNFQSHLSLASGHLGQMLDVSEEELHARLRQIDENGIQAAARMLGLDMPAGHASAEEYGGVASSDLLGSVGMAAGLTVPEQTIVRDWEPTAFYTLRNRNAALWNANVMSIPCTREHFDARTDAIVQTRQVAMQKFTEMVQPGGTYVMTEGASRVLAGWHRLCERDPDELRRLMTLPILDAEMDIASNWCAWFLQQLSDACKVSCAHFEILLGRMTAFDASRQDSNVLRPNVVFFSTACMSKSFAIRIITRSSFMCRQNDYESRLNVMADHVQDNCVETNEEMSFAAIADDPGKLALEKNRRTATMFRASRLALNKTTGRYEQVSSNILDDTTVIGATNESISNIHGPLYDRHMFVAMHPMRRKGADIDQMKQRDEVEGGQKAETFNTILKILETQVFMFNNMLFTGTLRVPPTLTVARECIRRIKLRMAELGMREPSTRDVDRWLVYVRTFAVIEAILMVYWNPASTTYYGKLADLSGMTVVESYAVARPHHVVLAGSLLRNQLYDRRVNVLLCLVAYRAFRLATTIPYSDSTLVSRNVPTARRGGGRSAGGNRQRGDDRGGSAASHGFDGEAADEEVDDRNYDWIEFGVDVQTLISQLSSTSQDTGEPLTELDVDHLLHMLSKMHCRSRGFRAPPERGMPAVINMLTTEERRPLVRYTRCGSSMRALFCTAKLMELHQQVSHPTFDLKKLSMANIPDQLEEALEAVQDRNTVRHKVVNLQPVSADMCHLAKTMVLKNTKANGSARTNVISIVMPGGEVTTNGGPDEDEPGADDLDADAGAASAGQLPKGLPPVMTMDRDVGDMAMELHFSRLEYGNLPESVAAAANPWANIQTLVRTEALARTVYARAASGAEYPTTDQAHYARCMEAVDSQLRGDLQGAVATTTRAVRHHPKIPSRSILEMLTGARSAFQRDAQAIAKQCATAVMMASPIADENTSHTGGVPTPTGRGTSVFSRLTAGISRRSSSASLSDTASLASASPGTPSSINFMA